MLVLTYASALVGQVTLELRKRGKDAEYEPSGAARRVDLARQHLQPDTALTKACDQSNDMLKRAPDAIKRAALQVERLTARRHAHVADQHNRILAASSVDARTYTKSGRARVDFGTGSRAGWPEIGSIFDTAPDLGEKRGFERPEAWRDRLEPVRLVLKRSFNSSL